MRDLEQIVKDLVELESHAKERAEECIRASEAAAEGWFDEDYHRWFSVAKRCQKALFALRDNQDMFERILEHKGRMTVRLEDGLLRDCQARQEIGTLGVKELMFHAVGGSWLSVDIDQLVSVTVEHGLMVVEVLV